MKITFQQICTMMVTSYFWTKPVYCFKEYLFIMWLFTYISKHQTWTLKVHLSSHPAPGRVGGMSRRQGNESSFRDRDRDRDRGRNRDRHQNDSNHERRERRSSPKRSRMRRSKSPSQSRSPTRSRRPVRIIPRYTVQIPKITLDTYVNNYQELQDMHIGICCKT